MSTIVENLSALTIGTVEVVSPNEIKVLLELDAPQATALNTGIPSGFPRLNGYVLIPNETGAVVGIIAWLGIERSAFPKRTGYKDFGLIDLPFPLRKLSITPVGTLVSVREKGTNGYKFRLERGVSTFPSVGDPVILPTHEQLRSIVESQGADRRIQIGTSPLAGNSVVSVDPDKLFGRHLAVLGNTGSGKSCSVAGLIRWSLTEASKERANTNQAGRVNARFIILDPNGEYSETFSDLKEDVRVFRVPPVEDAVHSLSIPPWMWNSQEWTAFASAAPGVQRPLLLRALRELKAGKRLLEPTNNKINRLFSSYRAILESMLVDGAHTFSTFPGSKDFGLRLRKIEIDALEYGGKTSGDIAESLNELAQCCKKVADNCYDPYVDKKSGQRVEKYNAFSEKDVSTVLDSVLKILAKVPQSSHDKLASEDAPIPFRVDEFANHLEQLARESGSGQMLQFVDFLAMRIRMLLSDSRLHPVISPDMQPTFEQWLTDYVGAHGSSNGQIAILDLSLVPPDVIHISIAVIARIIFEATQRYRKVCMLELPTVLVLEEAHTFVHRGTETEENIPTPIQMCRRTFERIAREGRKFGLGLVLSSQRPSELSPTVLAQCNTFLLHRIVNDKDQELVGKLVPDTLGALLRELPSLPTMQAILVGWATPIPALVEMKYLPEKQRPRSSDPKFWDVWTGVEERNIDWNSISKDWTS
ncbi:MAG: DUF87 domain-containing protein [Bacteroidota bacterium]|nr:DUF87 domain-containing protein [Bacteroidota bacterium]